MYNGRANLNLLLNCTLRQSGGGVKLYYHYIYKERWALYFRFTPRALHLPLTPHPYQIKRPKLRFTG